MKNISKKIVEKIIYYYKLFVLRDPYIITSRQWLKDNGDNTLRINYPLKKSSVVFDLGGYRGDWSEKIVDLYDPFIFIFEPVSEYYKFLVEKFSNNQKVKVYEFGLSEFDTLEMISIANNSSSIYKDEGEKIQIVLKDIQTFLELEQIKEIDLIKINIEGGEFKLLEKMLSSQIVLKCKDIQIQFHDFYPNAEESRCKIRESLQHTHVLTYDYSFIWENWRIK